MNSRTKSVKAGLLYFSGVFVTGFAFGGIRMMTLVPTVGETWAVVIETPFILGISWLLCARAVALLQLPANSQARIVMGGVALVCLLIAEYSLWVTMFGESTTGFFQRYTSLAGLYGLIGQVAYGLFPFIQIHIGAGHRSTQESKDENHATPNS